VSDIDHIIDGFAEALGSRGIDIHRVEAPRWVTEVESALPKGLPRSYQSLIRRYSFPAFELDGVMLFGNTESGNESDLASHVRPDKGTLQEVLLPAGYVQIGRPDTGDFDAICFDTNVKVNNREYPVVRIDHEQILCNWRITVVEQVWLSFYSIVAKTLAMRHTASPKG
jgi:hypothetical protein